jgi:hypothetical protein
VQLLTLLLAIVPSSVHYSTQAFGEPQGDLRAAWTPDRIVFRSNLYLARLVPVQMIYGQL